MKRVLLVLLFISPMAHASCVPQAFIEVASEYSLPEEIFYAMSLVESGRKIKGIGFRVWPWALNIDGQTLYPANRQAANALIDEALGRGSERIAVGVMQVYWRYHKGVFLEHPAYALDIGANLRAGAKVFKAFIAVGDGVWPAVGYYHAGTKNAQAAKAYISMVRRVLTKHVKGACHAKMVG